MADATPTGPTTSGGIVELRVHGVSGAGAGPGAGPAARAAGRRRPQRGLLPAAPGFGRAPATDGVTLEAYRWGDLPSGSRGRTLSLVFLLPFMLGNVAIWMRPANRCSEAGSGRCAGCSRSPSPCCTCSPSPGSRLDLVAWRCLGTPRCLAGRSWLSWLGGRPVGLRLAVLALVPVAAIGLVWWLGTRPGRSFEAFRAPDQDARAPARRRRPVGRRAAGGPAALHPRRGRVRHAGPRPARRPVASDALAVTRSLLAAHRGGAAGLRGPALHAGAASTGPPADRGSTGSPARCAPSPSA